MKSKRERKIPCDITYMWTLKYGTIYPIYKTETDHGHDEKTCICQGEEGEKGMHREHEAGNCELFRMDK